MSLMVDEENEAMPLVWVGALCFLHCFDTVDRNDIRPIKTTCSTNPQTFSPRTSVGRKLMSNRWRRFTQ